MSGRNALSYARYKPRRSYGGRYPRRSYGRSTKYKRGGRRYKKTFRKGYDKTSSLYSSKFLPRGQELKFFDTTIPMNSIVGEDGAIASPSLNLVSQGNSPSQMIGRKITIKQILMTGRWRQMAVTVVEPLIGDVGGVMCNIPQSNQVRMALILDKQCNGTPLTSVTDIYSSPGMQSFLNPANNKRFSILGDWSWDMNTQGRVQVSDLNFTDTGGFIDITKKINCNIVIEMAENAAARVINDVKSNNLLIAVWASPNFGYAGTGTTPGVRQLFFFMKTRIKYTDS